MEGSRHSENWYPERDRIALAKVVAKAKKHPVPGAVIEVGCWTGQSMEIIAASLGMTLAVDPWGDMAYADRPDLQAGYSYPKFIENTKDLPVVRFRCGWEQFFPLYDGPTRFLHLDAVHEYAHVKGNLEAILPYVRSGTILCGHDYTHPGFPGVQEAVDEVLGETVESEGWVWHWIAP